MSGNVHGLASKTKVVEFFGLPGAGKTTLTNRLDLADHVLRREDLAKKFRSLPFSELAALALRTVRNWKWLIAVLGLAFGMPARKWETIRRLVRIAAFKTWIDLQEGPVILDQGALQGLWSIFITQNIDKPPQRELTRLVRLLYADTDVLIIEIEVDTQLAVDRVGSRDEGSSRLDNVSKEAALEKLEKVRGLTKELLEAARAAGITIKTVSGSQPIETLAVSVGNHVAATLGPEAINVD